jgi:hypothetical protein
MLRSAHVVIVSNPEERELEKLQGEALLRKGVSEGRPVGDAIDEIFDSTITFLGIKVLGVARERGRVRKLLAA